MQHIGFIMDGNRRWAKKYSNIVALGHKEGGDNIASVLAMCLEARIPYVSMWALSKENIQERSETELAGIYFLIHHLVERDLPALIKKSIRLEVIGDLGLLPSDAHHALLEAIEQTKGGQSMTFVLAMGYSGQDEIIRAIKQCMREGIGPDNLDAKEFLQYLDSGTYPPPDLIVRTGGKIRHSGYFLYQSAYSEYYFTDVLWPDFDQNEFDKAFEYYEKIQRNFGK